MIHKHTYLYVLAEVHVFFFFCIYSLCNDFLPHSEKKELRFLLLVLLLDFSQ